MTKFVERLLLMFSLVLFSTLSQAAVTIFSPSGTVTVLQSENLYWDMLSGGTSTTTPYASGGFYLSNHGDFHFSAPANMVTVGAGTGGAVLSAGATVGPGSNWGTTSFAGTTAYSGTMVAGDTAYFGLSFQISGQTHYGWVQVTEGASTQSVLQWGYESTPNTPIAVGAAVAATPVPTLSEWGMIILSSLLALATVFTLRRRQQ